MKGSYAAKWDELNAGHFKWETDLHTDLSHLDELKVYDLADKAMKSLSPYIAKRFVDAKSEIADSIDELKVYKAVKGLYSDLETANEYIYIRLAKAQYERFGGDRKAIDKKWLKEVLEDDDPVTLYAYWNEWQRKRERTNEAVNASPNKDKVLRKSMKYWADMAAEYADIIAYKAMVQAFRDSGYTKVQWITERDDKVCEECSPLDRKIFDIDSIPPKPHWGCRCFCIPLRR